MKIYYKIVTGFAPEDYIEINADELEKAYYCFLMKKDGIFTGGAVRGAMMQAIKPDFHRIMGWNRGYKLGNEDFEELAQKGIDNKTRLELSESKEKVQFLIETGRVDLIGKNAKIETGPKQKAISAGAEELSKQMKIN